MAQGSGITATLIVKNEAALLPRCLASIREWVDAIIVADTGSTDDTPALARAAGATVLSVPWTQDFAAARNATLAAVQTPWVLTIDADETLVAADGPLLHATVAQPQADAYNLRIISLADQADQLSEAYVTRLFRHDPRIRWTGRVHEQVIPSIQAARLSLALAPIRLLHVGYLSSLMTARDKVARNRSLLERQLADRPQDPYVLWQWAQTVIAQGETTAALRALRRAANTLPARHPLHPLIWVTRMKAYLAAGDWRHAQTTVAAGLREWPTYTDLVYWQGWIFWQTGALDAAVEALSRAIDLGVPRDFLQTETGVATFKPLWGLVQCALQQQQFPRAEATLLVLLQTTPAFRPAWTLLEQLFWGNPIGTVGQRLHHFIDPPVLATDLALWHDLSPWLMALRSWAVRASHAEIVST